MTAVNVTDVKCLNEAICSANTPFEFEVNFEVTCPLQADLEWRMVYVGSATDETQDQELDCIELGPLEIAPMKFVFTAPPPNLLLVPKEDQLDVSVVFLAAGYKGQEFCRVGYYIKHEYAEGSVPIDPVTGEQVIPETLDFSKLIRKIDAANPRVTRFLINWDQPNSELEPPPAACEAEPEEEDIPIDDSDDDEEGDEEGEEGGSDMEMDENLEIATAKSAAPMDAQNSAWTQ